MIRHKLLLLLFLVHIGGLVHGQWNLIHQDSMYLEVADIHFFNKDTGLVCGTISHGLGFVLRTTDGGQTWANTTSNVAICMSLFFLNDSVGFTGSQDMAIYKTVDGGITWNPYCNGNFMIDYDGLHFFNDTVGILKSYTGRILKTTNHGATWITAGETHLYYGNYFYERNVNPFFFMNDSVGFATGHGIFKTTDQGSSWVRQNADTTKYLRSITMKNSLEGFAVGNKGMLLRTFDGGTNWTLDSISNQDLRHIIFIDDSTGFCVGGGFGYFNDTTGVLLQTTDGGANWSSKKISNIRLNSIQIIDSVGYIAGNFGTIFKHQFLPFIPPDTAQTADCEILIAPNPSSQTIEIKGLANNIIAELVIYDMYGNIILKSSNIDSKFIDISSFSSGSYLINTKSICGTINRKFMVIQN